MSISCEQLCPFLAEFGRRYACALQLKYFDWQALISHLCQLPFDSCESHIDSLLNLTVDHPHLIKYPIKPSYRRAFLKQFINKIEECDISHERTYEKLIEVLASEICTEDNYHFKHFVIGDHYISLKESVSAISQGTTGLCTWQAGVALANWGIRHKEFLCNRKVLELGSGSGLTGLALIYSDVTPSSYIFSDCHPAVLKQLQYNINLNNPESRTDSLKTLLETNVRILSLNWEDVEYTNFDPQFKPEVILAAG
ncbi:protein-lysine N-methyltransferase EEF2KMT [Cimex lectularius]|uniref:FAM86 N-terminal domain-containing protein n=1 Tax=Cimex lectularius TaxID=79782 RepID=A0A8I6R8G0_CIMLE|nr:protein-lysine N-methyltransferase EEF2KMT [Cimex lectularius]